MYVDHLTPQAEDVGQTLVVSVCHFPLLICPFSPRFFVLPSEGSVAEAYLSAQHENSVCPGLPPLSTGRSDDGEDIPPGAALTAQFLYHLATKVVGGDQQGYCSSTGLLICSPHAVMGTRLWIEYFHLFPVAREKHPSVTQKSSQNQLTQVPANVKRARLGVQIPLAKILGKNFRLVESIEAFLQGWNTSNSASQITELVNLSTKLDDEKPLSYESELLSGSLVSTKNFRGTPYLESILDRKTKDGTILIKKWLQETLRKENISVNAKIRPGLPSKSDLQLMIKALAKTQSSLVRNKGIIQLAAATLYAMDEKHSARWDAFISAEKILNVSAGDTSQSLAAQMSDIINKSALIRSYGHKSGGTEHSQGLLSFQDALLLTVTGYILAGENFPTSGSAGSFSWKEEHFLKEAIVDAVLENPEVAGLKFLDVDFS